jgi:hypothetical protein
MHRILASSRYIYLSAMSEEEAPATHEADSLSTRLSVPSRRDSQRSTGTAGGGTAAPRSTAMMST